MTSYRRTNDGSGQEVKGSTAGASGADDLGWLANLGELSIWLLQDDVARRRFVTWYNSSANRLGIAKSITSDDIIRTAGEMHHLAATRIRQVRGS